MSGPGATPLFIDTSALYARIDDRDDDHQRACAVCTSSLETLIITTLNPCCSATFCMLSGAFSGFVLTALPPGR